MVVELQFSAFKVLTVFREGVKNVLLTALCPAYEQLKVLGDWVLDHVDASHSRKRCALCETVAQRSEEEHAMKELTSCHVIVRMRRARSGSITEEFDATIEKQVSHPTFSDDDAQKDPEFVERLDDEGCQRGLVALAPHRGMIERNER
jgi:hypothetical protein